MKMLATKRRKYELSKFLCYYYSAYSWSFRYFILQIILLHNSFGTPLPAFSESHFADLTFLSTANESKLHQHDYHVIEMNILSKRASYIMHLHKPVNLFSPEHLDIGLNEMEHYECFYTGTVSSTDGNHAGMVSLSSCFHDSSFEGLLYLEKEHYHIAPIINAEPLPRRRNKRFTNLATPQQSKITVRHKITKPKMSALTAAKGGGDAKHRIDSKILPEEELKKARQQMILDQELLDDERDEDDNAEEEDDVDLNEIVSAFLPSDSEDVAEAVYAAHFKPKTANRKPKKKPAKKLAKVIELGLFTDEAFYKKWTEMYPQDTAKKINQYLLALVNNMNYLYQQPSMGPKISYRLVNVAVQQSIPKGLQPSETAERYLDSFCAFSGAKDKNGAIWDHAMMITGLPLKDQTGGDNLGIAFTSTMCLRYWSCSVVEYNKGFETTFTAAHELGHSLGMEHDGESMNVKCNPSKFLMAAVAGSGQINWSPCSNKNVQNFLSSGDPRAKVKDPSNVPRCLTKRGSKSSGIRYKTGQFPGRIFDVKKQCQQVCKQCTPYVKNKTPYNNVCSTLYCQNPSKEIIGAHPALEGTSCGQGGKSSCRNGKCQ